MSMPCLSHSADTPVALDGQPDAFNGQVRIYKREFQRELRRRPTNIQRALMNTAAVAQARFDQAASNPEVGAQDLAHLERVARRTAAAMRASFPARPDPHPKRPPTLSDTLAGVR